MTPAPSPERSGLIHSSQKGGQNSRKLNGPVHFTKQNEHRDDLRHRFRYVPSSGLDRFCGAHPPRHSVEATTCGTVRVQAGLPHTPGCC